VAETALALSRKAADLFRERGIESGRLEAELLLAHVLGVRRLDLYLQFDRPVTEAELERFRAAVRRRLRREPLQYIVGEAQFRTVTLRVDRRALIPRPETEILAGEVLAWAKAHPSAERVLDIGTGSGAIAIALAAEGGFRRVVATDISADALALAAENAERAGVADRIELVHGPVWRPLPAGACFDAVVSNPPYIAAGERAGLAPEVRDWEPAEALFAGEDGLDVVRAIVDGAWERLTEGGLLALEVGLGQARPVAERLAASGRYIEIRVVNDLAGRERIVLATRA
jgi:release factor glutamine methyltransferase